MLDDRRAEASDLLRGLIDKIVLVPDRWRNRLNIDLIGDLAGILSMASERERSLVGNDLANMQDKMVAGTPTDLDLLEQDKLVAGAGLDWSRLAMADGLMPRQFNGLATAAPPG